MGWHTRAGPWVVDSPPGPYGGVGLGDRHKNRALGDQLLGSQFLVPYEILAPHAAKLPCAQHLGQFERDGHFKLVVGAAQRGTFGAPAPELSGMAQTAPLEVLVGRFYDELRAYRLERQVLGGVPAAARPRQPLAPSAPSASGCPLCPGVLLQPSTW